MSTNQKLREALHKAKAALSLALSDVDWRKDSLTQPVIHKAYNCAHEALAMPTADHLPDAGRMVVDHFPDATKMIETAVPVGERERFEAWWRSVQLMTLPKEYDIERLQNWGSIYKPKALEAWQARAALSAGDAVDAQRYRWLREQNDDDFAFAVVKNPHFDVYESPEELDAAIDAAMRKDKP